MLYALVGLVAFVVGMFGGMVAAAKFSQAERLQLVRERDDLKARLFSAGGEWSPTPNMGARPLAPNPVDTLRGGNN